MHLFCRLVCILVCIIVSLGSRGQSANFTADVAAGCSPLVVHFTNTSTGATSYSWDLDNGTITTLTDPSGSYLTPGTFTVKLTAYNGTSSSVKTLNITVYEKPNVGFTVASPTVCNGAAVQFTNTSTSPSGGPLTYNWNFGDGFSSTADNPSHIFPGPGYYSITLDVKNIHGCDSAVIKNAYIHVTSAPIANFTLNSTVFCKAPAHAVFTDLTSGSGGYTYAWTFGDGHTSTLPNPTNDYITGGASFTVSLAVTDVNGCRDSITKSSIVRVDKIGISIPAKGCIFQPVTIINTTPDTSTLRDAWDFGDGLTSTYNNLTHTWNSKGSFTVKLAMTDGTCTDTASKIITIYGEPTFNLTDSPAMLCPAPAVVYFNAANGATGDTYLWLFDDGSTSTVSNPVHTYYNNGFFDYSIVVTDTNGCRDSVYSSKHIYDLEMFIKTSAVQGCIPLSIGFDDTLFTSQPTPPGPFPYPDTVATYAWDFGDGSPISSQKRPTHVFNTSGIFTVHLTVTTASGCTADDFVSVRAGRKPVITSVTEPNTRMCFNSKPLTLIAHAIGDTPLFFIWFTGAGIGGSTTGSKDSSTQVSFAPGIVTPKVVASTYGCISDTFRASAIITDSPEAIIAIDPCRGIITNCDTPTIAYFFDSSIGATSRLWLFSDGTTDTARNPVHGFPALGPQTATLITHNSRSGCSDTNKVNFLLSSISASFVADDTIVCKGDSLRWRAIFGGSDPVVIAWGFGDGIQPPIPPPNPDLNWCPPSPHPHDTTIGYTFRTSGAIPVTLEVVNLHYCRAYQTIYIHVSGPKDTFIVSPPIGCRPLNVTFTDLSTDVPGISIVNRKWDFGDNTSGATASQFTSHLYQSPGLFDVRLITTNNAGCSDTLLKPALITVLKPTAAFTAPQLSFCIGGTATFNNTSSGTGKLRFKWSFGDGGTDTAQNPAHTYLAVGAYSVRLIVTDSIGCIDTLIQPAYINIIKPHAAFIMSDSTAVCPPLTVVFTNTTSGGSTYFWDLGNGNTSIATNPSNLYYVPGIYTVSLVATSSLGCSDTVTHQVQLYGYAGTFTYSPLIGCSPFTVNFTANVSSVPGIRFDYADGTIDSGSSLTASHTYTRSGKYLPKLILSKGSNCQISSTSLDTIKVDTLIARFILGQRKVCLHDTVQLVDSSYMMYSSPNKWLWTFIDGQTSTSKNTAHVFNTAGPIPVVLIVSSAGGCRDTVSDTVFVNLLPPVTAFGDTIVCLGDSALLSATGGLTYSWEPADSVACNTCAAALAAPKVPALYKVVGKDANGCVNMDSVRIGLKYKTKSYAGPGGTICAGDTLQLSDSGAQQYTWYPPGTLSDIHAANPLAWPSSSQTYFVYAKEASCVGDTNFVNVYVNPRPTVKAIGAGVMFAGSTSQLQVTGGNVVRFLWSPAGSLNCDSCSDPVSRADSTTTYTVIGFSRYGCEDSDKVTIHVLCDQSQVFIPNTFTPNGDGQNDVFFPRGVGLARINSFRVYNRWGQVVFQRDGIDLNDEKSGWDGTFNGASPKPDVYIYYIDAICQTGESISWKGDITLVR